MDNSLPQKIASSNVYNEKIHQKENINSFLQSSSNTIYNTQATQSQLMQSQYSSQSNNKLLPPKYSLKSQNDQQQFQQQNHQVMPTTPTTDEVLAQITNHLKSNLSQPPIFNAQQYTNDWELKILNPKQNQTRFEQTRQQNQQNDKDSLMIDISQSTSSLQSEQQTPADKNSLNYKNILLIDDLQEPKPEYISQYQEKFNLFQNCNSLEKQKFNFTNISNTENQFPQIQQQMINSNALKQEKLTNTQKDEWIEKMKDLKNKFNILKIKSKIIEQQISTFSQIQIQDQIKRLQQEIDKNLDNLSKEEQLFQTESQLQTHQNARVLLYHSLSAQHDSILIQIEQIEKQLFELQTFQQPPKNYPYSQENQNTLNLTTNMPMNPFATINSPVTNLDDVQLRLLKVLSLVKKLNPSENHSQTTKFASLKQTLGIPTQIDKQLLTQQSILNKNNNSLDDLFGILENEINSLSIGYERKEDAKQEINQKMIQAIKQQQFKEIMNLKFEYEVKIQQLKTQHEEQLISQVNQAKEKQADFSLNQEIVLLNSEIDKLQQNTNQYLNEIAYYKSSIDQQVQEKVALIHEQLHKDFQHKEQQLLTDLQSDIRVLKSDWKNKNKQLKVEYEYRLKEKDLLIDQLKLEIQNLNEKMNIEYDKFSDLKSTEEDKYEKRLQLVKKMHEEQLKEMKRVIEERECEVEEKLMILSRQKEQIYQQAKEDARKENKEKTDKYLTKIERIKQQEIAIEKKKQRNEVNELKLQMQSIQEQIERLLCSSIQNHNSNQQQQMINNLNTPEQSFHPTQSQNLPGLDLQNLKDSICSIDQRIKNIEKETPFRGLDKSDERSQNQRSQNRLEKYKQSMFGNLKASNKVNQSMSCERLTSFQSSKLNLNQIVNDVERNNPNNSTIIILNHRNQVTNKNQSSPIKIDENNISIIIEQKQQQQSVQCDLGDKLFETLDFRVCLRCGLNDKIQPNKCEFHAFKCHSKSGIGKYMYSAEWHNCREKCDLKSNKENFCMKESNHYYGTHLPYNDPRPLKQKYQGQSKEFVKNISEEVMTEVSLLFNPFKKSSHDLSKRSTSRHNTSSISIKQEKYQSVHSVQRSQISSKSKSRSTSDNRRHEKSHHSSKYKTRDHENQNIQENYQSSQSHSKHSSKRRVKQQCNSIESSPLTTSKLQVTTTTKQVKYSDRIGHEERKNYQNNFQSQSSQLSPSQKSSHGYSTRKPVSPYKDQLDQYIKSQTSAMESYNSVASSKRDSQFTLSQFNTMGNVKNHKNFEVDENLQSKYLKTEQISKVRGVIQQNQKELNNGLTSQTSVNDLIQKSQNEWMKIENYLKSKQNN